MLMEPLAAIKVYGLLACFGIYLTCLFIFGAIYYAIYRRRPLHFLFNADVQDRQKQIFAENLFRHAEDLRRRTRRLSVEIEALRHLASQLQSGVSLEDLGRRKANLTLPSGANYVVEIDTVMDEGPISIMPFDYFRITCYDSNGEAFELREHYGLEFQGDWNATFRLLAEERERILKEYQLQADGHVHQARNINQNSDRIWSYLDFVYFSAIAQTTVGFGDILPNHTLVRMLVVLQILVGYGIFVVLLNIVLLR